MRESEVTQICPTPSDPMNCNLPGSSVYGIFQARVLEWVAISFSTSALLTISNPLTVWITTNCRKFLKRWEYQTILRNLYAGQEAIVRTGHGTTDWFQIGKGVRQGCILSLCLFNLYAEYIRNAGLEEAQAGIKIAGRNINNLRYADDTTLMPES